MTTDGGASEWLEAHRSYPYAGWCLLWPFFRDKNGRGVTHLDGEHYAHRLMCKMVHGDPPTPEHGTAHSCGAGHLGCVNPHHLSWKTQAANMDDTILHGTHPKNRHGPKGHFSQHEVEQIRRMLQTHTQLAIAQIYRVTESTISDIARGRYYSRPSKINFWTPEEDEKLRQAVEAGHKLRVVASMVGRKFEAVTSRMYRLGIHAKSDHHASKGRVSQTNGERS